ncbi:hypothetical protein DF185_09460 [Marinifilum breve]|uniref:DUF4861 domain-containing protein n=1 Tax=Marinifilum breve TaxID=2184082 RepID=A0A2V3ZYE7_9BACT|nr:DUF4861 family protein [Marinifilum breve]PXY01685.1 hypothetical protein DF185_09460 [Marinifilum breve]
MFFFSMDQKKYQFISLWIILTLFFVSCKRDSNQPVPAAEQLGSQVIEITNTSHQNRTKSNVEVDLHRLKKEMIPEKGNTLLVVLGDKIIPSQLDDLDNDGKPDELVFQVNIAANDRIKALIYKVSKEFAANYHYKKRTHAQLGLKNGKKPFIIRDSIFSENGDLYKESMHHGPALESEIMAYRMYFDNRSSIDIYGKIHQRLELDTTKWYSNDEFIANDYGGDILFVSKTIGIGSLRTWNGKNAEVVKANKGRYAIVRASGPVRSVIDMCALGVNGSEELLSRMMIYAGHREMIYRAYLPKEMSAEFCTGVRKMDGADVRINKEAGYISLWGTDYPRINHEKYPKVTVGLGVVVPEQWQSKQFMDDELNHLIGVQPKDLFMEYYVTAAWNQERNGIRTADEMEEYMKNLSLRVNAPLQISY